MINIKLKVHSTKNEVIAFLDELKSFLLNKDFNIDKDFVLISKNKVGKETFSTPYTLVDLEYDSSDIVERLTELTVSDYSETLVDKNDVNPPLLFVFGRDINGKQVYIKLKIKGEKTRHVLCVSFHYAEEKMIFPYR